MTSERNLDDVVHLRTRQGQQAAISSCHVMDAGAAALLLLFNGFTPTSTLVRMALLRLPNAESIVLDLEAQGSIARI